MSEMTHFYVDLYCFTCKRNPDIIASILFIHILYFVWIFLLNHLFMIYIQHFRALAEDNKLDNMLKNPQSPTDDEERLVF